MSMLKNLILWLQSHRAPRLLITLVKTFVNWLPPVCVCLMWGWAYKVYALHFCMGWILKGGNRSFVHGIVLLVLFHVMGVLALVSYLRCVFTSPKISAEDRYGSCFFFFFFFFPPDGADERGHC
jgi:hypothetical protein